MRNHRIRSPQRTFLALAIVGLLLCFVVSDGEDQVERGEEGGIENGNATERTDTEVGFADIIDRALEKEFPENEQSDGGP